MSERTIYDEKYRLLLEKALVINPIEEKALNEYKKLLRLRDLEYSKLAEYNQIILQLSRSKFFKTARIKKIQKKAEDSLVAISQYEYQLNALENTKTIATIILRESMNSKHKNNRLIF